MENEIGHCAETMSGFIGNDLQNDVPAHSFDAPLNADNKYKIISFFTKDNEYADLAARLEAGLQRYKLDYELVGIQSIGPWELNCAFKARFVKEQWEKSDIPVVWIDADATVEQEPTLFRQITCDFALVKNAGWEFSSGTVYFGKSDYTKALIDQWVLRCEADPITWDQEHLHFAWKDIASVIPLRTIWLPQSYYAIFDKEHQESPVVKHWQASRKSKREGRTAKRSHFKFSSDFKDDVRHNKIREVSAALSFLGHSPAPFLPREFYDEFGPIVSHLKAVTEIGCGEGHLAAHFAPDVYSGLEENPQLLLMARKNYPDRYFRFFDPGHLFPEAKTVIIQLPFTAWRKDGIKKYLLPIPRETNTIIVVEICTGAMASNTRQIKVSRFKTTAVRPMNFRLDGAGDSLSVTILERTLFSKCILMLKRVFKNIKMKCHSKKTKNKF